LWSYGGLKSQDVEKIIFFSFSGKNDPLRESFQNSVPKGFIASPIDVLCSHFGYLDGRYVGRQFWPTVCLGLKSHELGLGFKLMHVLSGFCFWFLLPTTLLAV